MGRPAIYYASVLLVFWRLYCFCSGNLIPVQCMYRLSSMHKRAKIQNFRSESIQIHTHTHTLSPSVSFCFCTVWCAPDECHNTFQLNESLNSILRFRIVFINLLIGVFGWKWFSEWVCRPAHTQMYTYQIGHEYQNRFQVFFPSQFVFRIIYTFLAMG